MGARSIYDKACPTCAAVLPRDAERCACGHDFASKDADAMQQTAVDDELYETYLTARIEQGLEALELARAALRANAGDYTRALHVMQQVHELRALRLELDGQRAKLAAARHPTKPPGEHASDVPTEAFRAAQAERADAVARRAAARGCSKCGCALEGGVSRCGCGEPADVTAPDTTRKEPRSPGRL